MGGAGPGPGVGPGAPGRSLKCSGSWAAAGMELGARGSPPPSRLLANAGGCSERDLGDPAAAQRESERRVLAERAEGGGARLGRAGGGHRPLQ